MKIVIAPDSFKETMSAKTVAATVAEAARAVWPHAECTEVPMADGGEGTTQSLVDALGGEFLSIETLDALGRPRAARIGWVADTRIAIFEVAEAIGIEHISPEERNPRASSTRGVGIVLREILALHPQKVIIGLGGSATNDGGWGMAYELGVRLFNEQGAEIPVEPLALEKAHHLEGDAIRAAWRHVEVILACDVNNPLAGAQGATFTFGPQKGVTPEELPVFDSALSHYGHILDETYGEKFSEMPGAGAAGGLGVSFIALLGAKAQPGVDVVITSVGLESLVADADLVVTGEGKIDHQTAHGKTPWGVAQLAKKYGVPVVAFAGIVGEGSEELYPQGFSAIVSTVREVAPLEQILKKAQPSLRAAATTAFQLLNTGMSLGGTANVTR
ncbi:MAG: glycerate kinase [Arcanobacterium sp.]|nr:glycerate kinase [Arcanobacterium sp.]